MACLSVRKVVACLAAASVLFQGVMPNVANAAQATQGLQGGWGVSDRGTLDFPHSLTSQLPMMREAQAGWVRINFRLGACYGDWTTPVPAEAVGARGCDPSVVGRTALQAYDQVVDVARANNLQVLGLLSNEAWHGEQVKWQEDNAETRGGTGDNGYIQSFSYLAAGVLAGYYKGRIAAWEVWNEPNSWEWYDDTGVWGSSFIWPSNFAWLLRHSYKAIKDSNASATVLAGAVLGGDVDGVVLSVVVHGKPRRIAALGTLPVWRRAATSASSPCWDPTRPPSGADFLCDTYRMGTSLAGWNKPYPFDDVAQHFYVNLGATTTPVNVTGLLEDLRKTYVAYEGPSTRKQTQVTEFGWTANPGVNQFSMEAARQAQNLQTAYTILHSTSYVRRAYWAGIQDIPEAGLWFGLLGSDYRAGDQSPVNLGLRKPAFSVYQRYAK
jgi:hypothetical protein